MALRGYPRNLLTGQCGPRAEPTLLRRWRISGDVPGELSQELGFDRTRVGRLGSYSGRGRGLPILKRFASEGAERVAGNEMALDVEGVLDRGVNGKKALR